MDEQGNGSEEREEGLGARALARTTRTTTRDENGDEKLERREGLETEISERSPAATANEDEDVDEEDEDEGEDGGRGRERS